MPDLDLFEKTEFWLVGITLTGTRLPDLAAAAARALSLQPGDVFVSDVGENHIVFDVTAPRVRLEDVAGRSSDLLRAVSAVNGVQLHSDAAVHSNGVLGVLGAPAAQVEHVIAATASLEANLRSYVTRRIAVVSTGAEIADGRVTDTNLEAIREIAAVAGYEVEFGGAVRDDERSIAGRVASLANDGFGAVVTTGGVGAEDKDRTIEALQMLDPDLATAVLATYEIGQGRHVKPHVRVGVGRLNEVVIIALPGPTREVHASLPAILEALPAGHQPLELVNRIAESIRALWQI